MSAAQQRKWHEQVDHDSCIIYKGKSVNIMFVTVHLHWCCNDNSIQWHTHLCNPIPKLDTHNYRGDQPNKPRNEKKYHIHQKADLQVL